MKIKKIILFFLLFFFSVSLFGGEEKESHSHWHQPTLDEVITHHLMDEPLFEFQIGGRKVYQGEPGFDKDPYRRYIFRDEKGLYKYEGGIPLHITKRVVMMWIVAILLLVIFITAANKIAKNPYKIQGRFANLVEVLFQFVRHDIAEANMHHPSNFFLGYILTAFFFILFSNLLGLFPPFGEIAEKIYSAITGHHHPHEVGVLPSPILAIWPGITVTGDIAVTFTLAAMTTILTWVAGFKYQGIQFIWHAVPSGVPLWLYPLLWPIEFLVAPLARGFALMIRLLANMTAGHVVILVIASFIFQFSKWTLLAVFVAFLSVFGMSFMYVLEFVVAFLQAFIFTLLSSIFIGLSMHRH
ncbi:MAG: F0F1 ATP synthase subunit A [Leptospiraceae bacterium]|nr:F0F1 ATP synthase subunit A [Leptospiraceae bacterium]MDW7977035.1 F0F1 ATP synthase subunit A [Leptospiraceae bacterium]